jgi:5-methylcytosine-specific restriction endonuclease McrA
LDAAVFLRQFQDHLAPRLDTYEQVIYIYVVRNSRLEGREEAVIGFKSARTAMALGIGKAGSPMSEHVCYEKLRSLEQKNCLKLLGTERTGTRLRVFLPDEIPGVIATPASDSMTSIEEMDFFEIPENRLLILSREGGRCFYCLRAIDANNYVIEHVVSQPAGTNGYRNVVAACRQCNNRKGSSTAEDLLRTLYRESLLSAEEFENRVSHLERLRTGELRPLSNREHR